MMNELYPGKIFYPITPMDMVREFHEKFRAAVDQPFDNNLVDLRYDLIVEELDEIAEELYGIDTDGSGINKKKLTKELADLLYVTYGTAVTFGLPLEEVFAEVHKSNMSKLTADGKVIRREDGKILKSDQYKEPDLERFF